MSTIGIQTIKDDSYTGGEVKRLVAPYGASVDLAFKSVSYKGQTPSAHTNITWKLIIKSTRDDSDTVDTGAIIDATNAALTLGTSPFSVGYTLDTTTTGFTEYGLFYGELWADDSTYGKNPVKEFQIQLGRAIRADFS